VKPIRRLKTDCPVLFIYFKIKRLIMKELRKNQQGLFICEECNRVFINIKNLGIHIAKKHKIKSKDYYDKWLKEKGEGKCKICGKETKFIIISSGYNYSCSKKCLQELRIKNCILKFGVTHQFKSKLIIDKSKQTKKERYGDEYFVNPKKTKQTKKERYGDENYYNVEKTKQTNNKRYNVDYPAQNKEIYEKNKKTNKERYGVEYTFNSKEIQEKGKQTKKERYGDENYNNTEKYKQTCLERYNVEYALSSIEIQNKSKHTCLKHFGVENPMQNPDIFKRAFKTRIKLYNYLGTNLTYQGSYEKHFLDTYHEKIDIENGLSFKYKTLDSKNHVYHSDFYIPLLNLVVEIKNSYLINQDKEKIGLKKNSVLKEGHNFILIINKDYNEFQKLID
jgi:hypothetical protein